jgi:hypothetical protein
VRGDTAAVTLPITGTPAPTFSCLETKSGWCATQAQARALSKAEVAGGVMTLCDAWIAMKAKPTRRTPTCSVCRVRLGWRPLPWKETP